VRQYTAWIAVTLLVLLSFLVSQFCPDLLRYDREALLSGEVWRLLTAHFSHLSFAHLGLNLAALALTAYVARPGRSVGYHFCLWLWLCLFTGAGLLAGAPDLYFYVGLSGALHGALIIYIADSPFYSRLVRRLVVVIVIGKIFWEQSPWFDDMSNAGFIGGRTETRSHLLGVVAGLIWVGVEYIRSIYEREKRSLDR
jgi:rhomboid family GlyGly-CTERM serine protease